MLMSDGVVMNWFLGLWLNG